MRTDRIDVAHWRPETPAGARAWRNATASPLGGTLVLERALMPDGGYTAVGLELSGSRQWAELERICGLIRRHLEQQEQAALITGDRGLADATSTQPETNQGGQGCVPVHGTHGS